MDQPTIPILHPEISISWPPEGAPGSKAIYNRRCQEKETVTSSLQTLDDFSYTGIPALVLRWKKSLNVNADYGEV